MFTHPFWTTQMCPVVTKVSPNTWGWTSSCYIQELRAPGHFQFLPTEKQSLGNQSRVPVGTVTFPKHNSNADDSPPTPEANLSWVAASSAADSHGRRGWTSPKTLRWLLGSFLHHLPSEVTTSQGSTATAGHPVMTFKQHSNNLRNASLLPQKTVGFPAPSNKTHITGWDKWNVKV